MLNGQNRQNIKTILRGKLKNLTPRKFYRSTQLHRGARAEDHCTTGYITG